MRIFVSRDSRGAYRTYSSAARQPEKYLPRQPMVTDIGRQCLIVTMFECADVMVYVYGMVKLNLKIQKF